MVKAAPSSLYGRDCFLLFVEHMGQGPAITQLGVSKAVFSRWVKGTIPVPRCAVTALYWASAWGQSQIDCDHFNTEQLLRAWVQSLEDENTVLREQLRILLTRESDGCANDVFFELGRLGRVSPQQATVTTTTPNAARRRQMR